MGRPGGPRDVYRPLALHEQQPWRANQQYRDPHALEDLSIAPPMRDLNPDVPKTVVRVALKVLIKNPEEHYPSAAMDGGPAVTLLATDSAGCAVLPGCRLLPGLLTMGMRSSPAWRCT